MRFRNFLICWMKFTGFTKMSARDLLSAVPALGKFEGADRICLAAERFVMNFSDWCRPSLELSGILSEWSTMDIFPAFTSLEHRENVSMLMSLTI